MKILTLDVWDTLIRRRCHPDVIKIEAYDFMLSVLDRSNISEKYLDANSGLVLRQKIEYDLAIEAKNNGLDDEYHIDDVISKLIEVVSGDSISSLKKVVEQVVAFEKNIELSLTYPDPTIAQKVNEIAPDKCYFISDFYIEKEFLLELLHHHGFDFIEDGISSCDVKLNKKSGRLFEVFRNDFFQDKDIEHIHIGDNLYADVESPSKLGIKAIHFLPDEEHQKRLQKESDFYMKLPLFNTKYDKDSDAHQFGKSTSMLYYGFARYIAHITNAKGLNKVAFLTREGEFYKEIYDQVNASLPESMRGAKSEILEVSRLATFFPSMKEFSLEEMMRVWNLYSTQSMGAMFKTLNIDKPKVQIFVTRHNMSWDEEIQYPWLDNRVKSLLSNQGY